jgi:TRAP-type C4-dicarboxylate transport system substrate-binding protein
MSTRDWLEWKGIRRWLRTVRSEPSSGLLVVSTVSISKAESEISRLNRGDLILAAAHPEVQAVLARREELYEETNGRFDMRVPFMRGVMYEYEAKIILNSRTVLTTTGFARA